MRRSDFKPQPFLESVLYPGDGQLTQGDGAGWGKVMVLGDHHATRSSRLDMQKAVDPVGLG